MFWYSRSKIPRPLCIQLSEHTGRGLFQPGQHHMEILFWHASSSWANTGQDTSSLNNYTLESLFWIEWCDLVVQTKSLRSKGVPNQWHCSRQGKMSGDDFNPSWFKQFQGSRNSSNCLCSTLIYWYLDSVKSLDCSAAVPQLARLDCTWLSLKSAKTLSKD